jgi:hypothetical protein
VSALRTCPGCGDRRILLSSPGDERLCLDCRDLPQGRLFGLEATLDDLELAGDGVGRHVEAPPRARRAVGCRCDRPLTDDDGGCVRCGRWAVA